MSEMPEPVTQKNYRKFLAQIEPANQEISCRLSLRPTGKTNPAVSRADGFKQGEKTSNIF